MPNEQPRAPRKPSWFLALLFLGATVAVLALLVRSSSAQPMRSELIVVLVSSLLATAFAAATLFARVRVAEDLESAAERFVASREGQVHAGVAWIASFTAITVAFVALTLLGHDGPKFRRVTDASRPSCPELLEHRVVACCHDTVRGVCEPCPTSTLCGEYCCDVPVRGR